MDIIVRVLKAQGLKNVVGIAQLVRAPDCGPGGREFDPLCPPHLILLHWGVAKWLRHRILIPAFVGSNPATPAIGGCPLKTELAH